jgi:hypothetical protein
MHVYQLEKIWSVELRKDSHPQFSQNRKYPWKALKSWKTKLIKFKNKKIILIRKEKKGKQLFVSN